MEKTKALIILTDISLYAGSQEDCTKTWTVGDQILYFELKGNENQDALSSGENIV